ncbi:hypothetical protein RQM65_02385 [Pricia sp. S334]|uniref:Outer membrane protein beta-barrel domain-containing protein n=1 Tax=Pricia mediterranea TaxID=3076079 RepID=A0ABU3L1A7_9FLAO|nr:hypothetical protein [Pricia sp. S334]MDT7827511.1 hypothetical protein [Pricia sp. S334]
MKNFKHTDSIAYRQSETPGQTHPVDKRSRNSVKHVILMTLAMVFGAMGISNAQLSEGDFMLGSDLGSGLVTSPGSGLLGFNFGLNDGAGYNIGLSPKVGYFIKDNFLIGVTTNLGFTKSPESLGESTKTTVYGVQALSRYYLFPGQVGVENLLRKGRFFIEANGGISGVNVVDGPSTNGFALGFGPGYSYFITDNVALETSFKYNGLAGGGDTSYQHSLGLNLGIQIFLPSSQVENRIDREIDN